jgi:hypothetical protein
MPTTIITGRDVSFTISASTQYSSQATSATLTVDTTINTYQTLAGKTYFTTDTQGSFAVEMLADWGAGSVTMRGSMECGGNRRSANSARSYH